jgi:putative membrane protein
VNIGPKATTSVTRHGRVGLHRLRVVIAAPPLAISTGPLAAIQIAPLMTLVMLYGRRARTLSLTSRAVPRWRQACFYGGFLVIFAALILLGKANREPLFVNTIEQLLLGDVAALLLVLGLTAALIAPLLRVAPFDRLRIFSNPLIAFPLWTIDFYGWHLPVLYEAALRHPGIQILEHAMLLGLAVNMWMCLFGPLPTPAWFGNTAKLLYIIAVRLAGIGLANLFLWSDAVFYPFYLERDSLRQISPIADQNIAGAIMMIEGSLLTIGLFCWLFMRTAREGAERQDLLDFARRHGVALSEQRAARAIAAGRGGDLRKRLEQRVDPLL